MGTDSSILRARILKIYCVEEFERYAVLKASCRVQKETATAEKAEKSFNSDNDSS